MRFQTLSEARWIFVVLGLLAIASAFFFPWLLVLIVLLIVYVFWFFRDPARVSPDDPNAVVAAADGTVADIFEIAEPEVVHTRPKRGGVFPSVFGLPTKRGP